MYWLTEELAFPHPRLANEDGLLAIGGDLSPERLLLAYQYGIFPWYNADMDEPILWWFMNPRFVLIPSQVYISKTMRQVIKRQIFTLTIDTCFERIIEHCSKTPRRGQDGTWLQPELQKAYIHLHELGFAHSFEVWQAGELVGGLYGMALGKIFYGESMFSLVSNASKFALISMCQFIESKNFKLVDCQVKTEHLASMGATDIDSEVFLTCLEQNMNEPTLRGKWKLS